MVSGNKMWPAKKELFIKLEYVSSSFRLLGKKNERSEKGTFLYDEIRIFIVFQSSGPKKSARLACVVGRGKKWKAYRNKSFALSERRKARAFQPNKALSLTRRSYSVVSFSIVLSRFCLGGWPPSHRPLSNTYKVYTWTSRRAIVYISIHESNCGWDFQKEKLKTADS